MTGNAADGQARIRRGKGRPMSPDAVVGRDALIKAACELLEQMPAAKVTRAEVARHAGVDPALIRYYFRDRASLLQAVVQQIHSRFFETGLAPPGASIEERVRSVAANSFSFMMTYPFLHRLAVEELAGSPSEEGRALFRSLVANGAGVWKSIIDDGAAIGELKAIDPVLPYLAVIGLCESYAANRLIMEDLVGDDSAIAALTPVYAQLVSDMVLRGLRV